MLRYTEVIFVIDKSSDRPTMGKGSNHDIDARKKLQRYTSTPDKTPGRS
ncbi:hypothetical protein [Limnospira platensis]